MYGIIHQKLFDSTVIAEGYEVAYVMICMVTFANEYDICAFGDDAFARRINMPLHKVKDAIAVLSTPDPESESQEYEGRRLVNIKEIQAIESNRGWFVVNRRKYIELASKTNRSEINKRYYQSKKDESQIDMVLQNGDSDEGKTHVNVNVNVNKPKTKRRAGKTTIKKFRRPTLKQVTDYCKQRNNGINPQEFIDSNNQKGWVVGKFQTPMKDWKAAVCTWERFRKKNGAKETHVGNEI